MRRCMQTHRKRSRTAADGAADRKNLLEVCRRVSATIGADFFEAIAKHLAEAIGADGVFVVEFIGGPMERCRSVGGWLDGAPSKIEYELAGSATAEIALGKASQLRSHAMKKFPSDGLISTLHAEAYLGVPLRAKQPLGALLALYRKPMASLQTAKSLLDVFAGRAAAELTRKSEEDALRQSEERYRAFIAKNGDAMWRLEFEQPIPVMLPEKEQFDRIYKYGYLAECNEALARLLGFDNPDQLIGARVAEIAPPKDPTIRQATMVAIRAGYRLSNVETCPIDRSGRRRCIIRSQWGIVEDGGLQRVWGSSRDITDLRETEIALHAAEQRMAELLESMRMLVVFLDAAGNIDFCNGHLYELTGWTAADLKGKPWLETMIAVEERDHVAAAMERGCGPDQRVQFESTLTAKDGPPLQIAWDSIALRSADERSVCRALIGRDVTEQKGLEEQLRQAQKLGGIGRLAGGLAHDFNNLLTVILGYTTKLLDNLKPSDPAFMSLAGIQKATERGAELAHRLLTFSRRHPFRLQTMNVNAVVEDSESLVRALIGERIRLVIKMEASLRLVRADPTNLQQVLINLAANARDAMPEGGILTVATANFDVDAGHPHPAGIPEGEYVLLTVADTGSGMTAEVKSHLFEPFFSTKQTNRGTGLGLATVYGIVQQTMAHIRVDSEMGRGTAFRIFFPKADAANSDTPRETSAVLPQGHETILLVEERQEVRALAAKSLRELGYTVLEAEGPLTAMEISGEETIVIDLLISEAAPHGMPGHVLLDMVRAVHPEVKVLFMADPTMLSADGAVEPGADYLPEPISPWALARKVRVVLDRR